MPIRVPHDGQATLPSQIARAMAIGNASPNSHGHAVDIEPTKRRIGNAIIAAMMRGRSGIIINPVRMQKIYSPLHRHPKSSRNDFDQITGLNFDGKALHTVILRFRSLDLVDRDARSPGLASGDADLT